MNVRNTNSENNKSRDYNFLNFRRRRKDLSAPDLESVFYAKKIPIGDLQTPEIADLAKIISMLMFSSPNNKTDTSFRRCQWVPAVVHCFLYLLTLNIS